MFYKIAVFSVSVFAFIPRAMPCSQEEISQKAMKGALYLESLNVGGEPLTKELYSLSSEFDTYVAVLSYSGVQNFWKIKVNSDLCLIKSIERHGLNFRNAP